MALETEADRRCAAAEAARAHLADLGTRLVAARTEQAERQRAAADAEAAAEPDELRAGRNRARAGFHVARQAAHSAEEIAAAASDWLAEIERINGSLAETESRQERERAAAEIATAMVEHLQAEAESARLAADAAEQACGEARRAAEACVEAVRRAEVERLAGEARAAAEPAAAEIPTPSPPATAPADAGEAAAHQAAAERALGVGQEPSDERLTGRARTLAASTPLEVAGHAGMVPLRPGGGVRAVAPGTAIHRILSGEVTALASVAEQLGSDPDSRRHWETRLIDLLEAILLRAVDAGAIALPTDHPFWGAFTAEQSRDIISALSALGCRFDGFGGWLDDRVPTQRDLSIAVAHAGLDPMRIRRWPTPAESEELVRDADVLGAEYLNAVAPGLTFAEMTSLLGQDALPLADVWLEWDRIRELLVAREAAHEPE